MNKLLHLSLLAIIIVSCVWINSKRKEHDRPPAPPAKIYELIGLSEAEWNEMTRRSQPAGNDEPEQFDECE